MASLFDVSCRKAEISVLDPGAGMGILAAALLERFQVENVTQKVTITCYETDKQVLLILSDNLKYLKENSTLTIDDEKTQRLQALIDAVDKDIAWLEAEQRSLGIPRQTLESVLTETCAAIPNN